MLATMMDADIVGHYTREINGVEVSEADSTLWAELQRVNAIADSLREWQSTYPSELEFLGSEVDECVFPPVAVAHGTIRPDSTTLGVWIAAANAAGFSHSDSTTRQSVAIPWVDIWGFPDTTGLQVVIHDQSSAFSSLVVDPGDSVELDLDSRGWIVAWLYVEDVDPSSAPISAVPWRIRAVPNPARSEYVWCNQESQSRALRRWRCSMYLAAGFERYEVMRT